MKTAIVIGAGPAGLTAAWELRRRSVIFTSFIFLSPSLRPNPFESAPGALQIPLQIIRKGAFSTIAKWCADFSDTPLLTCGFDVFRGGVRKSVFLRILFPLNQNRVSVVARGG